MADESPIPPEWAAYLDEMAPRGHVAVDRTAALILGVDTYSWLERDQPLVPETAVIGDRRASRMADLAAHSRDLAPVEVVRIHGVPTTTPLRTAMDLGCVLKRWQAFAAMNALAGAYDLAAADFVRELPRHRRRRGVCQLRALIGHLTPEVESMRESRLLLAILDAGLPVPRAQHRVDLPGGEWFRVDFAYPHRRIAVEYDGSEFHDSTEEQRRRDRRRRDLMRQDGWEFIVVTSADFRGRREGVWLTQLRDLLAATHHNRRW
ncbi:hypothetical protein [Nocardioides baekrokdamisoli]|uniref:hypothetical protein n=1 Tax=Nocardioides baekrokdamisoli TaxID=1804624 RepID=UPI000F79A86D|nr:hypothetical protein [Nocardioides baekrokdamisoli]